jgi:cytochrome b561
MTRGWHWMGVAFLALAVVRLVSQWHWHEERRHVRPSHEQVERMKAEREGTGPR